MKRAVRIGWLALLVALLMIFPVAAAAPKESAPALALPTPLVDDRAGVLSAATEGTIERDGAVLRDLTGLETAIVTVDFLGGHPIEEVARSIFDEREPGDPAHNNGLVLLLCIGEEDYFLLPGEGLTQTFPAEALSALLDDCLEADFAAGDYDGGVSKVFDRLRREAETLYGVSVSQELALRAEQEASMPPQGFARLWPVMPLSLLLAGCLLLFVGWARRGRRRKNLF